MSQQQSTATPQQSPSMPQQSPSMPVQQEGQAGYVMPHGPMATQQDVSNLTLWESLTPEMYNALEAIHRAAVACEWCADRCIDEGPQMAACIRLCRDAAELGTLSEQFIARDSVFGSELAQTFLSVANACAQECAQHPHRHCQDCASALQDAIGTVQQMIQSNRNVQQTGSQSPFGGQSQMGTQGAMSGQGQSSFQQSGAQPMQTQATQPMQSQATQPTTGQQF